MPNRRDQAAMDDIMSKKIHAFLMLHMGFKIVTKPLLFSSGFPMLRK
jgi:hypothetical protein